MYDYIGVYVEGTSANVNDDEFTDGEISDDSGSTENGMSYAEEVLYYTAISSVKRQEFLRLCLMKRSAPQQK